MPPPPDPARARRLWTEAGERMAELRTDSVLALLRAARAADPRFLPAHFAYIELLREAGAMDQLRREYAEPARPDPLAACLAAAARAPHGYPDAAADGLHALERRFGPGECTSTYLALWDRADRAGGGLARWERAARHAPADPEFWARYVEILHQEGRWTRGEQVVRERLRRATGALERVRLYALLAYGRAGARDTAGAQALWRALRIAARRDGRPGVWLECSRAAPPASGRGDAGAYRERVRVARSAGAWPQEWKEAFGAAMQLLDYHGDPAGALPYATRAVQLADSVERPVLQAQAYMKRGRTLAKMGRVGEAERDLARAIRASRAAGDSLYLAESWHNLAHVYEADGRLAEASRAADRFVALTRPLRNAPIRMMSLHDAGTIRWKAGWHAAAGAAWNDMVRVVDELGTQAYWAGEYLERAGELDRALEYYRRARAGPDQGEAVLALAGLVRVFGALGMADSAETAARQHDARIGRLFDIPLLPALLARRGRVDQAVRMSRGWAEMRLRQGNVQAATATLLQTAGLLLDAGRPRAARVHAERAESLAARMNLVDERIGALRVAGTARMRTGQVEAGLADLRRAAELARAHPTASSVLESETALGDGLAAAGRAEAALAAYDRAARSVQGVTARLGDDLDRAGYRGRNLAPFDGALRLLLAQPPSPSGTASAALWSQRRKGAALSVAEESPGPQVPEPLPLHRLQDRLGPDRALVDYLVVDSAIVALVVTARGASVVRLPTTAAEVGRWTEALRRPLVSTYAGRLDLARARYDLALARRLYEVLLAPLEAALAGVHTLAMVPDGPLHRVPFDALVTAEPAAAAGAGDRYAAARYVIDRYEVVYLPSAQFLAVQRHAGVSGRLLAVAPDAPDATREVRAISAAWPRARLRVLGGGAATETETRAAGTGFDVVHFAAHARADERDPLASHLALVPDARNDGYLHLGEIADGRWRARLVVLSACETVSGPLYGGEGMMGLARAFLSAGAGEVVGTQWPVGGQSAALMVGFYRGLAAGREPSQALHTARLAVRADPRTAHPFYWASFVLVAGRPSGPAEW